jgi:putative intracellular protease/amidase
MKKCALIVVLVLIAAMAAPAPASPRTSTDGKDAVWVCPPCSCGADDVAYDRAGRCPVCGMTLVRKGEVEPASRPALKLAILLFDGVEIIDYTGPWEVFGQTSVNGRPAFEIYTVAANKEPITTSMGMSVNPTYTLSEAPQADVLLLPGGNVDPQLDDAAVMQWIKNQAGGAGTVLSVCNGAFFLARAGLLDGLEATTFAGLIPKLQKRAPKARVVSDRRFVDNGKIVTSAGLSAGVDAALHVVEKLFGRGEAEVVATGLEYHWQPDSHWARAMLADRRLLAIYRWIHQFPRTVLRYEGNDDRWSVAWNLESERPPAAILEDLERTVAEKTDWTPISRKTGSTRAWRLEGPDGASWIATVALTPSSRKKNEFRFDANVARAGAGSARARPAAAAASAGASR